MASRKTKASHQSKACDIEVPPNASRTTMSVVMRKDELHKIQCIAALRGTTVSQMVRSCLLDQGLLETAEPQI